jgi:hypothetical protein
VIAPEWLPCNFGEHVNEVRARHVELSRLMGGHPLDSQVTEAVWLHLAAVTELLDHFGRLHEDGVLVRLIES